MIGRRALVAAAFLMGAITVPAANAPAQPAGPAVTLSPGSAGAGTSGTWPITVSGTGFAVSKKVDVTFAGVAAGSTSTNAQGAFSLPISPTRRPGGTYSVVATQSVCQTEPFPACFPVTGSTQFASVPPIRAYDEPSFAATGEEQCGPAGPLRTAWSVHASGTLWPPGNAPTSPNQVAVIFYNLTTVVSRILATVQADGTWRVNGWAVPAQPAAPAGTYTVRAMDPRPGQGPDVTLAWNVPCRPPNTTTTQTTSPTPDTTTTSTQPTTSTRPTTPPSSPTTVPATTTTTLPPKVVVPPVLACSPCLGPAGFVTLLTGTGFPGGAAVRLRWSPGLGEKLVSADAAGSFSTQMLVMPGDAPGQRQAMAEVSGGGPSAATAFLVVPSTVTPSGRDVAQMVRLTQLVNR